jgi:hypothetical protein
MPRTHAPATRALVPLAIFFTAAVALVVAGHMPSRSAHRPSGETMLILRGIASADRPRGQLDDQSALEYARRLGYRGEVLDVAGGSAEQARKALDRIHNDSKVTALYGFSGGGYNAKRIWAQLNAAERDRIDKVVVVGAPGVGKGDFPGSDDVVIKQDPPAGHMAGPKALLESLGPT